MNSFLLHMMRHGAPASPGRMHGHNDVAPTEAGIAHCIEQAQLIDFDHIYSSDLTRASTPAAIIAAHSGHELRTDARWRELDFGAWNGVDPATIDPQALARFWANPDSNPPPGGERWCDIVERVTQAVDAVPPRPTLVIAHAGAMRAAVSAICGFSLRQCWALDLPYGAVLSLRIWEDERRSGQIVALWP